MIMKTVPQKITTGTTLLASILSALIPFSLSPVQARPLQQLPSISFSSTLSAHRLANQSIVSLPKPASPSIHAANEPSEPEVNAPETNNRVEEPAIIELPLDGQPIEGALTEKSQQLADGSYVDIHFIQGQAGQEIKINLSSQGFNPVLSLLRVNQNSEDPDDISFEEVASNTDVGSKDFKAKLSMELQEDGNYLVVVTTASVEQTGTYTLNATTDL